MCFYCVSANLSFYCALLLIFLSLYFCVYFMYRIFSVLPFGIIITNDAVVGGIEEGDKVPWTRLNHVSEAGYLQLTGSSPRTDPIQ